MHTFQIIRLFSLLLFILVIAGCQSAHIVKDVEQPAPDQSIVFDRVDVVIDGEAQADPASRKTPEPQNG